MPSNVPAAQRGAAAAVLAAAFADDAIWNEVKPTRPARAAKALYLFFRAEVAICARLGGYLQATFGKDGSPTGVLIAYERNGPDFPWWVWFFRLPAIALLGPVRTVQMARMLAKAEAAHPTEPHFYFWYVGSRLLGGGSVLFKRVMKVARQRQLPCYGEAKSEGVVQMCEILGWQSQPPLDLGYGHKVTPVWWAPEDPR